MPMYPRRAKPGWYILVYHDVSWEEDYYLSSLGGTCPPDILGEHLDVCRKYGTLVSIEEGRNAIATGNTREPLFSIWFDDGYSGAIRHGVPLVEEAGVTGAVSVCSRFLDKEEIFWRCKLSFLNEIDGLRILRSKLRAEGLLDRMQLRFTTLTGFTERVSELVDEVFNRLTTDDERNEAWRLFFGWEEARQLQCKDWIVANHTARHWPVGVEGALKFMKPEFWECEESLRKELGIRSEYWVLPFDIGTGVRALEEVEEDLEGRKFVIVGNRMNSLTRESDSRRLYRFNVPIVRGPELIRYLVRHADN